MIHADYLLYSPSITWMDCTLLTLGKIPRSGSSKSTADIRTQGSPLLRHMPIAESLLIVAVSTATLGSSLETGGLETKLIAVEIATAAGVTTIITSSRNPASHFTILKTTTSKSASGLSSAGDAGAAPAQVIRPPHTLFTPSQMPLWLIQRCTVCSRGKSRGWEGGRERLLTAGVLSVRGAFASGQAVRVLVREDAAGSDSRDVGADVRHTSTSLPLLGQGHHL